MNTPPGFLSIDTPENVTFGYEVAGIGSRFLAALVDTIVILLLQALVNIITVFVINIFLGVDTLPEELQVWVAAIFGLLAFILLWGYYILFEMSWNGQSLGKRWVGLRVIKTDGTPVTLIESLIRNLIRLVDFLPLSYGLGVVTMFVSNQSRRLGDLAAGTLVIHDQKPVILEALRENNSLVSDKITISPETNRLPLERLDQQHWQVIEAFLSRRAELTNRTKLGGKILQDLYKHMALPAPQEADLIAERLLMEMYRWHQMPSKPSKM